MRMLVLSVITLAALPQAEPGKPVPTAQYETRTVEGWTVRVNKTLLGEKAELGARALRLLEVKLFDVTRAVPPKALAELRKAPIWLGVNDGHAPCAEYHVSREWLSGHGFNPDKAKGVEIGNAERFLSWSGDQPSMVLHELAHAYHDRVLTHAHEGIRAAHQKAVEGGTYESVLRASGKKERAYAIKNFEEYFAEATEAFFGTNDYYPFVKAELRIHDPGFFKVVEEAWSR